MEKELKVLFVIDSLGAGGAEKSTAVLADFLWKKNIYFEILCLYNRKIGVQQELQEKGYPISFVESEKFIPQVREISKRIKNGNFTVTHSILFKSNMRTRMARFFTEFVHLESLVSTTYSKERFEDNRVNNFFLRIYKIIDRITAVKCVDFFHSISETVKTHYMKELGIPEEKIKVIYRGREPFKRSTSLERHSDIFQILNLGRHEFAKGQINLLKAAIELRNLGYKFKIKIYGRTGEVTPELQDFISRNSLENCVILEGFKENVSNALTNADLFVFPSRYEGLGGSLIEAMSAGLPIACNNLPVFYEIVVPEKNAKIFDINKIDTMVKAIRFFIDNPEVGKEYGNESLNIFQSKFLVSESNSNMLKLYRELYNNSTKD